MASRKKAGKSAASAEIEPAELEQRVAILRRFRELLIQQRDRFRSYLEALDSQQAVIESGDADALLAHVELEERIVADIFSIQKVIDPLDNMYRALVPDAAAAGGDPQPPGAEEVSGLKAALENLKVEAAARSARNRELLLNRMAEIRTEITALRNNPFAANVRRSAFSDSGTASLIDIQG
jgi:hypothetical protein